VTASPLDGFLERLVADPAAAALFTDFDGTLAPIVDDPADARPLPAAVDALDRLGGRLGVVGVLSGRPVATLAQMLPDDIVIAGLYGLEVRRAGAVTLHPDAARWGAVVDHVADLATAELPDGVGVEHKGLSLTLHTRTAPRLAPLVEVWAAEAASNSGLERRAARRSVELHPPLDVDKGTTLLDLAGDATAVCFIGDDVGDLAAFDALDTLAARGAWTLRVAVRSDELDPRLEARADVVVDGPEAVAAVFARLADRLG
jgi:trehalose 6-phosphate phosphatase